ncbi:carboxylesterase/lipase family protein [Dictyobacter arantiisoli]|nr:carboxylesterase/lipase family protein [Dictyobacter arantiisoli]
MRDVIVETSSGALRGKQQRGVSCWKGIPFAQPPLGALRWRAPQRLQPWTGIRDATRFGSASAQPDSIVDLFNSPSSTPLAGEDCLYLNIWSPAADQARRPVLVWLHGGAFVSGSGAEPWTDGSSFARNGDIVVVTLNYRLGALGFLYLDGLTASLDEAVSNRGLLDQIAALEWIQENIAAFGGDPECITLAGESAGAMSIGSLLAVPRAHGLFHRAILESGACRNVLTRHAAMRIAQTFLAQLGLDAARFASLETIEIARILAAQQQCGSGIHNFSPVIDGTLLTAPPLELIATGSASDIPLLIGTNRDEARMFTLTSQDHVVVNQKALQQLFGAQASQVLEIYRQARADGSAPQAWIDILTDRAFRIPAIRLAEQQLKHNPHVWMYRFDWPTPAFGGRLGACHALEIPFAWNTLDSDLAQLFTDEAPNRQELGDIMHAAWISFIRTGNPNLDPRRAGLPDWPCYNLEQRPTMLFNQASQLAHDPQSAERQCWPAIS